MQVFCLRVHLIIPHQTGDSYLEFLARVRDIDNDLWMPRRERLLDVLGLADARHARLSTYSFGMVRKITLAGALLMSPSTFFSMNLRLASILIRCG